MAHGVVLDVELRDAELLAEVARAHEGREADRLPQRGLTVRAQVERQQVGVAPDAVGPALDARAGHTRADDGIVVVDLEGAEAELADVNGGGGVRAPALPALQSLQAIHGLSIGRGFEPRK